MIAALILAAFAATYVYASLRVRWPLRRTACFVAGIVAVAVGLAVADQPLSTHMIQHAIFVSVAAPLLVLAAPVALALRVLHGSDREALLELIRSRPVRLITHPTVAWPLFIAVQWVVNLTPLVHVGDDQPLLHAAVHAAIFWSAVLFWLPVIGHNPIARPLGGWERSIYLFAAAPALDLIGALLLSRGENAAAIAMLAGMLPVTFAAIAVTWSHINEEHRHAVRMEAHAAG